MNIWKTNCNIHNLVLYVVGSRARKHILAGDFRTWKDKWLKYELIVLFLNKKLMGFFKYY
jgi:hypothetical protein